MTGIADRLRRRWGLLDAGRGALSADLTDIRTLVWPHRTDYGGTGLSAPASPWRGVMDTTAADAANRLAALFLASAFPVDAPWLDFAALDPAAEQAEGWPEWRAAAAAAVQGAWEDPGANLRAALSAIVKDWLVGLGLGVLRRRSGVGGGLRLEALPLGLCRVAQGREGQIDVLACRRAASAAALEREYPGRIPPAQRAIEAGRPDDLIELWEWWLPSDELDGAPNTAAPTEWANVLIGPEGDAPLDTRLLPYRPIIAPRWSPEANDPYGVGPMRQALGAVRALNQATVAFVKLAERRASPPIILDAGLDPEAISLAPAALNIVDQADLARRGVRALEPIELADAPQALQALIAEWRAEIGRHFLADRISVAPNQPSPETATAILQRRADAARSLRPQLDTLVRDVAAPMVQAMMTELRVRGRMPSLPPSVAQAVQAPDGEERRLDLRVLIADPLARQIDLSRYQNGLALLQAAGQAAAFDPTVPDNLDMRAMLDFAARALDLPPGLVRSAAEVAQIRSARADAEAQAAEAERLAAAAQAAAGFGSAARDFSGAAA